MTRSASLQTQCGFFARRGYCNDGDACGFLHGDVCPLDQRNAQAEAGMRAKLQAFAADGSGSNAAGGELAMGPELNSYQRRLCHGIADECKLGHASRGDGKQRQIYCWRLASSTDTAEAAVGARDASAASSPAASDADAVCHGMPIVQQHRVL